MFDPVNPDEGLLRELIMQKINAKREKRKLKPLTLHNALQQTAEQYIAQFRYTRFENNQENKKRLRKHIKKNCQAAGYKNAYLDFQIRAQHAMNYYGTHYYYDKEDTETSTHLFLVRRPGKTEKSKPGYKPVYMKTYTYDELATLIVRVFVRDDGFFSSLNNGYDKYGFALTVDKRTLYRNRIPQVKVLLILGGNRINW